MCAMPANARTSTLSKTSARWHGFNLLNYFNADYPEPFREEEFRWISQWGFNFVRIPISYWCWSKPGAYYQMDENVLRDLDRCVQWGKKYHVHVCLNLHRAPGYCVNPPAEPEDLFRDESALRGCAHQWQVLAKRYAREGNKYLSFNLLNEVANVDDATYERIVRHLVGAIRSISPKRLIMVDGLDWGTRPLLSISDLDGIMQCGRGYQPMLISHYEASWVFHGQPMSVPRQELTWPLDAEGTHYDRTWLRQQIERPWKPFLEQHNQSLFIGEFGAHNRTPHPTTLAWLRDQLETFRSLGLGWTLWNLRGSFGILDSGRDDVPYTDFHGHQLDTQMLHLLQEYAR